MGWSNFRTLSAKYKIVSLCLFAIMIVIYVSFLGGEFIFPQAPEAIIPRLYVWLVIVFIFSLKERAKSVSLKKTN